MIRKTFLFTIFLIALLFCRPTAGATEENVYRSDKITSHLFCDIVQDPRGYIWIATEYGLNRFDGTRFKQYYADKSEGAITNNFVRCMAVTADGELLIGCDDALMRYDNIEDKFYEVPTPGNQPTYIKDIAVSDKTTLVLDNNGVILRYADGKLKEFKDLTKELDAPSSSRIIYIDGREDIWIGTASTGVLRLDSKGKKLRHFDNKQLNDKNINHFAANANGQIYIATSTKLWRYDRATDSLVELKHDEAFSSIRDIIITDNGLPIVGTYGRGLYFVDESTNECKPLSQRTPVSPLMELANVTSVYQDRDGNIWAGCFNEGLVEIADVESLFETFDVATLPGGSSRSITLIYNDTKGNQWIGQEQNGLFKIAPSGKVAGRFCNEKTPLAMAEDNNGNLHVGFYDNLIAIINPENGNVNFDDRLGYIRTRGIVKAPDGSMWYGIFNQGLARRNPDGSLTHINDIPQKAVNKLYIDSDTTLWIAHYNGVDALNTRSGKIIDIQKPQSLTQSIGYAVEEHNGLIFIGTSTGLYIYNKAYRTWEHYGSANGLSNEFVCGIVEDNSGSLWLSTYRGLNHFNPENGEFVSYFVGNGLKNANYARSIYSSDKLGNVYFSNDHSIVTIHPDNVSVDMTKGKLVLTQMIIHHNIANDTADSNYRSDQPIEEIHDFTLTHSQDVFSMYFSTFDFIDSDNIQLQYRLNESERWLTTDPGDSKIQFTRLPSGTWNLEVRAINNGHTSEISRYRIKILPPWYGSWWAICFYILIATGAGLWAFRMWVRHQTEANNEAKIRFFIDLAHEFRSPITLMLSPLDKLLKKENDKETSRALRNIYRNASRMMQLLNQTLDIRKIDKGQMKISCRPTDIVSFVKEVCHVFDYEADKRQCKLGFTSTTDKLIAWIDPDHFDKILYNLLSNAFRYVPDGGSIDVAVMTDPTPRAGFPEGSVRISVTDSGPGIKESQMKQIFDRFYQISPRSHVGSVGYGLGLNLSRQLVELHHGIIEVENRNDGPTGARFIVTIPLGKRHLNASQISENADPSESTPVHNIQPALISEKPEKLKYVQKKNGSTIVIVDDDEEMRNFLITELHSFYKVTAFDNASKALQWIVKDQPDLVVTDVVMPGMDGLELLHRIKSNSRICTIPVILLTSNSDADERIKGLQKGADAYICKPFLIKELLARIQGLISNHKLMKGKFSGAQDQENRTEKVKMKDADEDLMETIMKILNAKVDDPSLNVETLSAEIGISRAQLHRRMKDITGISCGEFIRNFRLKHAAKLLAAGSNVYVSQVAYACGFSNATNFSTTFKKYFGMSPSEYSAIHAPSSETNQKEDNTEPEESNTEQK